MAINGEDVEENGRKGEDGYDYADDVDGEEEIKGRWRQKNVLTLEIQMQPVLSVV